jgi:hypothetical protein
MDIDFDDAGVGRHLDHAEPRIGRRLIPFDMHGEAEFCRRRFNHGEEFEIVRKGLSGWHEHT